MSQTALIIEKLFRIYDKESQLVDFHLNKVQAEIDILKNEKKEKRISILKPRQKGCSSYIMADFLVDCMSGHQTAVMLAHDRDHTERLLRRAQEFLENIKGPKPKITRMNANEIYFPKTQSTFYIGTAGSKNFGRSATITRLHCSEIAFWTDPKTILTGLLQSVPKLSGVVILETTANGWGTWYQRHWYNSQALLTGFKPFFFGWNIDDEYTSPNPLSPPPTPEEQTLKTLYDLSDAHIQWRREKLWEFDNDESLFKQEYPLTYEEAFRSTGGSLFPNALLSESPSWTLHNDKTWRLSPHPIKGYNYVLGADSSGGTGNDFAAITILCADTLEQVLSYQNNRLAPPSFSPIIATLGKEYNNAYLIPESNSHGLSTLALLKETYPLQRIFRRSLPTKTLQQQLSIPSYSYGWQTTAITKPFMIGAGQRYLAEGFKIHCPLTYDQLKAFTEDPETKHIISESEHDDLAIALLLALVGLGRVLRHRGFFFAGQEELFTLEPVTQAPQAQVQQSTIGNKKIIDISKWRNEKGEYLLKHSDIFAPKKGKKAIHV